MALSSEDRERIYEEEKARRAAQDRLQHEAATTKKAADAKHTKKAGIGCLSIIAALLVFGLIGKLTGTGGHRLLAQTSLSCAPTPDEDDSTLHDTPRPPMPTRILRWRAAHTQAAFLYSHRTGEWQFLAFQDANSKYPISVDEARRRLCR